MPIFWFYSKRLNICLDFVLSKEYNIEKNIKKAQTMKKELKEFIEKYEICDGHAHIFPEKIAQKAVESIGHFYDLDMFCESGTSNALINSGNLINITHYLVCSTATVPHQVESINHFIVKECKKHPELIGFGTLHPDYDDIEGQVQYCIDNGLRGIKLHSDFQKFNIDDPRAYKIYEIIEGRLPVLLHMGDNRYDYSSPKRLKKATDDFKNLIVFASHFGGYQRWDEALKYLAGNENIYYDTSSSLAFIDKEKALALIDAYGTDKLFFGCDFPMWKHSEELERFMDLELNDTANSAILSGNFKRFFNIC